MQDFEKRAIIAITVVTIFIAAYYYFFFPQTPVQTAPSKKSKVHTLEKKAITPEVVTSTSSAKENKPIIVNTPNYTLYISPYNGTLDKFLLKKYKLKGKYINLVSKGGKFRPLETIFALPQVEKVEKLRSYSSTTQKITIEKKPYTLLLSKEANGIKIIKAYTFFPNTYGINLKINVFKNGRPLSTDFSMYLGPNLGNVEPKIRAEALIGHSVEKDKDINDNKSGKVFWIGIQNKYFALVLLPSHSKDTIIGGFLENKKDRYVYANFSSPASLRLYGGPKEESAIAVVDEKLEKIIDFGMFGFISKPLLRVLNFFYSFLGNYGLAILLLTFIIRLVFYPLNFKSFKSMKEMAKLQPKLKELQNRYKGKPEQLNKATMQLYKEHHVNPFGGCLPMIIQIPIFIALYDVLLSAIQLRGAPFCLWITDLSAKDPYYILPVIMGLTMYLQQKLTPTGMDPKQAKLMLFLPIVFTIMFLNFPSGLVLYWTFNNILTIIQMVFIDSKILKVQENRNG